MPSPVRLRVGLNLLWLGPGVVGGSEEYTTRLLDALGDRASPDIEYTLFVNRGLPRAYPELCGRFETVVAPVSGRSKSLRVFAESAWMAPLIRRRDIDVVHYLGGVLPAWRPRPAVLTIHDLQPLAMPEHFSFAKRQFSRIAIPRSVRHAQRIVTLTEYTKADLVRRLAVDPSLVVVVPPGFDPPDATRDRRASDAVRARYDLGNHRYFLYPAITYPHKDHLTLVRAFAAVAAVDPDVVLVLTGGVAQTERELMTTVASLGLSDRVRRTGRIPELDLDALYRDAVALTFPSLSEGFGLPVLEAMSRDCAVIAADATALPEVVDGAGLLVAPRDAASWSAAMRTLLDEPATRHALVVAGRARSSDYPWETSAESLEDLYRQAAAG